MNVKSFSSRWHYFQIFTVSTRRKKNSITFYFGLNKRICASISMAPECMQSTTTKNYARFLFTKSGYNKVCFFLSRFSVDSHVTSPDCTYLCVYNLKAEIAIIFESNFFFQFFSLSPRVLLPHRLSYMPRNCARQPLFSAWIFNAHFTVVFILRTHSRALWWKCIENFHLLKKKKSSIYRWMSFKSELRSDYKDRFQHKLQLSLRQLYCGDISICV